MPEEHTIFQVKHLPGETEQNQDTQVATCTHQCCWTARYSPWMPEHLGLKTIRQRQHEAERGSYTAFVTRPVLCYTW